MLKNVANVKKHLRILKQEFLVVFDYIMDITCYSVNTKYLIVHTSVIVINSKPYWRSEVRRGTHFVENIDLISCFYLFEFDFWEK